MATFFSGTTIGYWSISSNVMYGTLTGFVNRSGNTVTLSSMVLVISSTVSSTGSSSFDFTVNGVNNALTIYADGSTNLGSYSLANTSFSAASTQTSASIGWSSSDGYSGSFTVTFPAGAVAPNTPTVSAVNTTSTSNTITFGTSSYGTPSSGTVTLFGGTTINPTAVLSTSTSTGDNTFVHSGLTPNTTYYYRAKATNGTLDSGYSNEVNVTTSRSVDLYGSVNNSTKRVIKLYGPLEKLTSISFNYGPTSGGLLSSIDSTTFLNMFLSVHPEYQWKEYGELQRVSFSRDTSIYRPITYLISVSTTNGDLPSVSCVEANLATWGITATNYGKSYANISPSYVSCAREIKKLYGSVNGETKLVYQA